VLGGIVRFYELVEERLPPARGVGAELATVVASEI